MLLSSLALDGSGINIILSNDFVQVSLIGLHSLLQFKVSMRILSASILCRVGMSLIVAVPIEVLIVVRR